MKPNQDLLVWSKWPHLSSMVNDVALRLGLAPYSGGELTLDSDHGIIAQRIAMNVQSCLSRGWWFNTIRNFEVHPDDWNAGLRCYSLEPFVLSYSIPLHQLNGSPRTLRVVHSVSSTGSTGDTQLFVVDDDWDARYPFTLDLMIAPVDDSLPFEFSDYVVIKTTNQLANIFNVPVEKDPNAESRAWYELQRADAVAEKPFNMIEDNPITWATTRRR